MENGKYPDIDSLLADFYKSQYKTIKNDLLQLYNSILFQNEKLTPLMNQAVITLIPKNV